MNEYIRTGLKVEVYSQGHPYENAPDDSGYNTNKFRKVTLDQEDPNCVIAGEIRVGDIVHVLWAEYTTGDSFGRYDGQVEVITAFQSAEAAVACQQTLQQLKEGDLPDYHMLYDLVMEDGGIHRFQIPWLGYFEHLEVIHIETVKVQGGM